MSRNLIDLTHLAHISGQIGRLQTISVIPVIPGDSVSINIDGIFRLAPTRKEIVAECQIDICAFFVPHRHVWPAEWKFVVTEGLQTSTALTAGPAVASGKRDCFYLGIKECGATVNRALVAGYNGIYQRYFAVPTTDTNGLLTYTNGGYSTFYADGVNQDSVNTRKYGMRAARLPHILNGMVMVNTTNAGTFTRDYTNADWGVQIPQDTPSAGIALLDIRDLKQIQSRYSSIQEQNYFAQFYDDVLKSKWNTSGVNADADPRPTYLGRDTHFVSGTDVNGTDDATLGTYVGKTLDRIRFNIPRRFMPEHGNIWIMMLARFPLVHTKEQHPLLSTALVDQKLLLADPKVWAAEPVAPFDPSAWLAGGSLITPNVDQLQQPYGQEYRYQPNRIHPSFETIPGYPFTQWDANNPYPWYYYQDGEYNDTFQTSQIGHWQTHAKVSVQKYSSIVDPKTSIFAGA